MKLHAISGYINDIKSELDKFERLGINVQVANTTPSQFNELVRSIKTKALSSSDYFSNIFDNDDYYDNISSYLAQSIETLSFKAQKNGVSISADQKLQAAAKNIKEITDVLLAKYSAMLKNEKNSFLNDNTAYIRALKAQLKELVLVQERLEKILKISASVIANVVLSEFKIMYKFFLYSMAIAKSRGDQLLLVEIASKSDAIIEMIEPIFSEKSLKTSEMIYHYLVYELKGLKAFAMEEKIA